MPAFRGGLTAVLWLALAAPALAIVGGGEAGESELARSSVMVLTSTGGVCTGLVVARDGVLTAIACPGSVRTASISATRPARRF